MRADDWLRSKEVWGEISNSLPRQPASPIKLTRCPGASARNVFMRAWPKRPCGYVGKNAGSKDDRPSNVVLAEGGQGAGSALGAREHAVRCSAHRRSTEYVLVQLGCIIYGLVSVCTSVRGGGGSAHLHPFRLYWLAPASAARLPRWCTSFPSQDFHEPCRRCLFLGDTYVCPLYTALQVR